MKVEPYSTKHLLKVKFNLASFEGLRLMMVFRIDSSLDYLFDLSPGII